MIELRDTVTVDAAPQEVWHWLEELPEHTLEWHADHRGARWVRGGGFVPGAVMEVHEILHGKPHRLRMAVTEVEPGRRVRYRVLPGLSGDFVIDAADGGTEFTAVITMGSRARLIGPLLDRLLRWSIKSRIEAIERHQAEEGANLKLLMERPHSP